MPRTARAAEGGVVYHVLNRGNNRQKIFCKEADYAAFMQILGQAKQQADVELFAFCLMPTHWHLVLRPRRGKDLAAFLSWLSNTHVKRYRAHYRTTSGHLYQGRFKSFPVQDDGHLRTVLRYVEANPLRARLVDRAQRWPWSSLGQGVKTIPELLSPWPVDRPADWTAVVNEAMDPAQVQILRASIVRDRPYGAETWVRQTALRMGLDHTLRPRGRPHKTRPKTQRAHEKVDVTF